MTNASPPVSLNHRKTATVDASLTVPHLASSIGNLTDMPPVFATAYLETFIDAQARQGKG